MSNTEQITTISIHAPREGGDPKKNRDTKNINISIHAPREGGDHIVYQKNTSKITFQSTPPARGATVYMIC